jgi:hypothetical protein
MSILWRLQAESGAGATNQTRFLPEVAGKEASSFLRWLPLEAAAAFALACAACTGGLPPVASLMEMTSMPSESSNLFLGAPASVVGLGRSGSSFLGVEPLGTALNGKKGGWEKMPYQPLFYLQAYLFTSVFNNEFCNKITKLRRNPTIVYR